MATARSEVGDQLSLHVADAAHPHDHVGPIEYLERHRAVRSRQVVGNRYGTETDWRDRDESVLDREIGPIDIAHHYDEDPRAIRNWQ